MRRSAALLGLVAVLVAAPAAAVAAQPEVETPVTIIEVPDLTIDQSSDDQSGDEAVSEPVDEEQTATTAETANGGATGSTEPSPTDEAVELESGVDEVVTVDPPEVGDELGRTSGGFEPSTLLLTLTALGAIAIVFAFASLARRRRDERETPVTDSRPNYPASLPTASTNVEPRVTPELANGEGPAPGTLTKRVRVLTRDAEPEPTAPEPTAHPPSPEEEVQRSGDRERTPARVVDLRPIESTPLTSIPGIGAGMAAQLRDAGIQDVERLASLTPAQIGELRAALGSNAWRLDRGDWIEAAREIVSKP